MNPPTLIWRVICVLTIVTAAHGCALAPTKNVKQQPALTATQLMAEGTAAEHSGDPGRALINYVNAAAANPKNAEAHYRIARVQQAMGNLNTAQEAYERAVALAPAHAGALEGLGLLMLAQGNYEGANRMLQAALARAPSRWRTCNGLGVLADLSSNHLLAQSYFTRALKTVPLQPELLNNQGYSLYLAGQLKASKDYFERALASAPGYRTAWSNLALVRIRLGDNLGAIEAFSESLKPYQAYNNVGYLLYVKGDYAEARPYLEKAIALSPAYYAVAQQNLDRLDAKARKAPEKM